MQIKTFEEIINSVSFDDLKTVHLQWRLPQMQQALLYEKGEKEIKILKKGIEYANSYLKNKPRIQDNDTLKNIAHFARIIAQIHPGWENPGFEKDSFKRKVEALYNEQSRLPEDKRLKGDALLTEFFKITATTLQDNHLSITNINGKWPMKGEDINRWGSLKANHSKGTVGKNIAYYQDAFKGFKGNIDTKPIMISETQINGKKVGIVALSTSKIGWGKESMQNQMDFWNLFQSEFEKRYKNWDNIIIDVRGNSGGTGGPVQRIAETLWGDKRPYCLSSQKRNTQEVTLQEIGHFQISEQPEWQKTAFKGHKKGLYILTDKETASGAEAIFPMLKDYPNVQFIGENTSGCCQYGALRPVALPCGGWVNIGSIFRRYSDGLIECVGHKPNINCSGQDAYQVCLNLIQQKTQSQQQAFSLISEYKNKKSR